MIVYTGAGIVPVLLVLLAFIGSAALDGPSVPGVRPPSLWPLMGVAAVITFVLGRYLNRNGVRHTLYGVRMEYTAFAIVALIVAVEVLMSFSPARRRSSGSSRSELKATAFSAEVVEVARPVQERW